MEIKIRDLYSLPFTYKIKKDSVRIQDWDGAFICRIKGKNDKNILKAQMIAYGLNMLVKYEQH